MNKEEKEAMIKENIQLIYQKKKSDMEARESKDEIGSITYYETLELFRNEDGGGVSKQDAYLYQNRLLLLVGSERTLRLWGQQAQ